MNAYRPAWLEISPANLQYNCETVKKLVGDQVKVCAVVKANGYGHGAVEVAAHEIGQSELRVRRAYEHRPAGA